MRHQVELSFSIIPDGPNSWICTVEQADQPPYDFRVAGTTEAEGLANAEEALCATVRAVLRQHGITGETVVVKDG